MPKFGFLVVVGLLSATVLGVFLLVLLPDSVFVEQELDEVPVILDAPPISFIDPVLGEADAKTVVVEYSDYTCGLCRSIAPVLREFIDDDPKGRALVWKDAPRLDANIEALDAAMAARCAKDQGYFWEYHDELIGSSLSPSAQRLENIATEIGLDFEAFEGCMASGVTRAVVMHTLDEAMALGATGTPTVYVNGVEFGGPFTLEGLKGAAGL